MKKVIENFQPQGGMHCISNALKQVFAYYQHPLSEAMIFGLASGISFVYVNQASSPMVSGRSKIAEFENNLAKRLQISIKCKSYKDYAKVEMITKNMIDLDEPVLIYVDMPYLSYLSLPTTSHFGGHAVVLFGYDDEQNIYFVSDRDHHDFPIRIPTGLTAQDYHLVEYQEMKQARTSTHRPFPANNKYLTFDFTNYKKIDKAILQEAIQETCETMLNPPAHLLGIQGILKFSKEIRKWKTFTPQKLKLSGTSNYFMIHEDGGTGGGIFRNLYGNFLIEAAPLLKNEKFIELGEQFIKVSKQWDEIANDLWTLSLTCDISLLDKMSNSLMDIYTIEKNLFETLQQMISK